MNTNRCICLFSMFKYLIYCIYIHVYKYIYLNNAQVFWSWDLTNRSVMTRKASVKLK